MRKEQFWVVDLCFHDIYCKCPLNDTILWFIVTIKMLNTQALMVGSIRKIISVRENESQQLS